MIIVVGVYFYAGKSVRVYLAYAETTFPRQAVLDKKKVRSGEGPKAGYNLEGVKMHHACGQFAEKLN